MRAVFLRFILVLLLSCAAVIMQRQNQARAQSCGGNSCPDDCQQEDAGDSCTNDYGTDCTWQGPTDYCKYPSTGCPAGDDSYGSCCIQVHSPIVIDTTGDGFQLTNAKTGVLFPITESFTKFQTAWTSPTANNAWLVLDRNGNGLIDNGKELFGNYTPQPAPSPGVKRNGFLALAVYDRVENGGNADGVIDERDGIYSKLRLWIDANHNGISEPSELFTLPEKGVEGIELAYSLSKSVDSSGNSFRYRSRVFRDRGYADGRWAWDVYLGFEQ